LVISTNICGVRRNTELGAPAIWAPDGQYHAAGAKEDALVMAERDGDGWKMAVEVVAL